MAEKKSKKLWFVIAAVLGLVMIAVVAVLLLKPKKANHSNLPMEEQAWYACEDFIADMIDIESPGAYDTMDQQHGRLLEDGSYELTITVRYDMYGNERRNSYYCRAVYFEDEKEWGIVQLQPVQ